MKRVITASNWKKPKNFNALKKRVAQRVTKLRAPTETAAIANDMRVDARHVRWACTEIAAEHGHIRLRRNKRNRMEVIRKS